MIIYEITATLETVPAEEFEQFMRLVHIPDLLATGFFHGAEFPRVSEGVYRARYLAESRAALDEYLETASGRLRQDFCDRFPAGISVMREIPDVLQTW